MKKIIRLFRRLCFLVTFGMLLQHVQAQEPPFYKDIQNFKKQDSVSFPSRNALLFIGSSSFTMWRDVQDYFPGYVIINRGFGGSSLHHLSYYIEDIVYPYHPKQVVVYCGENDLATSDTVSAATVTERFITLFNQIREKYPEVPVAFVSMKPSPSRERLLQKMITANKAIQKFLETQKGAAYIDVYSLMLDAEGRPRRELFLDDMLHMNKQGYEIWQKAFRSYLVQ
ncbi:MAG: G-D-S-L family lipolytic protein [Chitinophagaceae bacterium]|nr:G-D-S-L family lipolytic protein [Chitinophagaceae bacterium]MCW5927956.1 G-D-S-L family lipolytic protein [Chitinophagaceae bacterium]